MSGVVYRSEPSSLPLDQAGGTTRRFELSRGNSLTPKSACVFVGTVALATLLVAGFYAAQGFWPVLPFAGLEIAFLIWAVKASMRSGLQRETIIVTEELVTIQHRSPDGDWD